MKGRKENPDRPFRDLIDYIECVEGVAKAAMTFTKEAIDGDPEREQWEGDLRRDFEALCADATRGQ